MPAATRFRTLRFYHNAMQTVAEKHGLTVKRSYETFDGQESHHHCTILLPNGCPVSETSSPEALDKFLTLLMPAFAGQAFRQDPLTGVTLAA